ncbi:recombinase family protein [Mucilaginibacter sp.]|uniref:recombinase family protein n=3 Tax=Mucilaginibacter sp. TaxID=1882438 RepID=UPI0025DDF91D|nr:recombinase family protein [Mucilaginibacter sp.]
MRVKYNRVSTLNQSGNRFTADNDNYDLILLDKISGSVSFKDRPRGKELTKLIENGKVTEIVCEEFSRLGRNTGDVISVLNWLDEKGINVVIRNNGLQSRPSGIKNPIWNMISSVMASLYQMELENIKERTTVGRIVYVQNGGKLGRPKGTSENQKSFLNKQSSQQIIKALNKGLTVREAGKVAGVSTSTVMKVKSLLVA